jgi:uncharacterized surface protein with fasciclin (FAS1) repeats
MADNAPVTLELIADNKTAAGLQSAATDARGASAEIASAFGGATGAGQTFGGVIGGLSEKLREHRSEHVQTSRAVSAFTREISGIIGPGNEAAKVLGGLLGGLAMGGGFGLALEGIKEGIGFITRAYREAGEAAEAATSQFLASVAAVRAGIAESADAIQSAIDRVSGMKPSEMLQRQANAAKEIAAKHAATAASAGADADRPRDGESVKSWIKRKAEFEKEGREQLQRDVDAWNARARAKQEEADVTADVERVESAQKAADKGREEQKRADAAAAAARIRDAEAQKNVAAEVESFVAAQSEAGLAGRKKIYAETDKAFTDLAHRAESAAMTSEQVIRSVVAIGNAEKAKLREEDAKDAQKLLDRQVAQTKHDEDEKFKAMKDAASRAEVILHHQAQEEKKAAEEAAKAQIHAAESIGSAFGDAFAGIAAGTKSLGQAFGEVMKSIVQVVMEAAIKQITANASVAASGAAASQAGIPLIGPVLAAGAMTAMLALVMGLIGNLTSSSGGYEVPSNVSASLGVLHPKETVLPADLSTGLKDMIRGGNGAGSGGDTLNFTIHAFDGPDVERTLLKIRNRLQRNGRW